MKRRDNVTIILTLLFFVICSFLTVGYAFSDKILDLDGVVFDSENLYRVYTEMYDVDVKKGNNIINNSERTFQKRITIVNLKIRKA